MVGHAETEIKPISSPVPSFRTPSGFEAVADAPDDAPPQPDLAPLLDVIFLLLTFFVLSIVLMVRAEILDVRLPELGAGETAAGPPPITVSLATDGTIALDGLQIAPDALTEAIRDATEALDEPTVAIAVDTDAASGDLLRLVRQIRAAGIERFGVLGASPTDTGADATPGPTGSPLGSEAAPVQPESF